MKKLLFSLVILITCKTISYGQVELQFQTGVSSFHLNFPGFQTYLSSYNTQNSGSSMIDSAKFNQFGAGYHFGGMVRLGPFVAGINVGQVTGFQSKATYTYDQSRSFQFKNNYFDVQMGGRIGGKKFAVIPYFNMTINTLNLYSFYTYDKVRSYGGEKDLNGIYTSWRLIGMVGGRMEYRFTKTIGAYVDLGFTINKSEYLGGSFDESNSATDAKSFQSTATQDQIEAITGGLKEMYRITRGVFGIQLTFGTNEDED